MESSGSRLTLIPSPSRLVVRPFDALTSEMQRLGIVLPENAAHGRNTNGIVVTTHRGPQSIMVGHDDELYWINVGDQVIFPAMAGNEITVPEPTAERPRHQQRYIMIQERDVIAKIEATEPVDNVTVEPRQYVSS